MTAIAYYGDLDLAKEHAKRLTAPTADNPEGEICAIFHVDPEDAGFCFGLRQSPIFADDTVAVFAGGIEMQQFRPEEKQALIGGKP